MVAKQKRSRIPDLGRPEVTELEFRRRTHKVASVEPMDVDGVRTMTIGTVLWGIAALALLPFWGTLQQTGRTWWLWAAIAGLGLGLIGIEFCKRRREALAASATSQPSAEVTAEPAPAVSVRDEPTIEVPASAAEPVDRPVGRRRKN